LIWLKELQNESTKTVSYLIGQAGWSTSCMPMDGGSAHGSALVCWCHSICPNKRARKGEKTLPQGPCQYFYPCLWQCLLQTRLWLQSIWHHPGNTIRHDARIWVWYYAPCLEMLRSKHGNDSSCHCQQSHWGHVQAVTIHCSVRVCEFKLCSRTYKSHTAQFTWMAWNDFHFPCSTVVSHPRVGTFARTVSKMMMFQRMTMTGNPPLALT
jgi:hypothetical protein